MFDPLPSRLEGMSLRIGFSIAVAQRARTDGATVSPRASERRSCNKILASGVPFIFRFDAATAMPENLLDFTGKVGLITSGSTGIGRATALAFAG
jgi:hypothetical protein